MVATNDDILLELQKQTAILKKLRNLERNKYMNIEDAKAVENNDAN